MSPPPAADQPILRLSGIRNAFGDVVIHDGLDLEVRRGEVIALVGGSGSGKSVLLRTIIGLNKPVAGTIEVLGKRVDQLKSKALRDLEGRWGVLFQNGALFSALTVAQNIHVPLKEQFGLKGSLLDEIAALKIALVGLPPDAADKFPAELSGGMVKRAALARALALDPEIVFLDEPTAGLDPIGAAAFDRLIADLRDTVGFTVFMVTHDLDTLATVCDRIAVLGRKRVMVVGTMEEMLDQTDPWIVEYFHGPRGRAALAAKDRAAARQTPAGTGRPNG